jgi:hypothetical protein
MRAFGSRSLLVGGSKSSPSRSAIYVMTDQTGSWPVLWSDPLPPRSLPGHRTWRFVAKVDDAQIVPMLTALLRKREAGEL